MKRIKSLLIAIVLMMAFVVCASCGPKKTKITIIQYLTHNALDKATEGIIAGLEEGGYIDGENVEISVLNPQTKADTLSQMVEKAVEESDLIFAIATPVAQSLVAELKKTGKNVPVLFTAITDPVATGIVEKENRTLPVSGTSDINPVAKQVAIIKDIYPDKTSYKMGFIYTTGEDNSEVQLDLAKAECANQGIEITAKSCTNEADLDLVLGSLLDQGLDALYIPTDNEMAAQMQTISQKCDEKGVITICGETGMVESGGTITVGAVDYYGLGKQTGKMGVEALKGADVAKMEVGTWDNDSIDINKAAAETTFKDIIPAAIIAKASLVD